MGTPAETLFPTPSTLPAQGPAPRTAPPRLAPIDVVRGAAMALMALDHVRYFLTDRDYPPENLLHTTVPLFFTRWVTHLCAPAFFLLAGTGALLSISTVRPQAKVAAFLWKRGAVLVVLELTVVGFGWQFTPGYSFAGVIWCLGLSMLLLAPGVRFLSPRAVGIAGLTMILLHHSLDGISSEHLGQAGWLWSLLHQSGTVRLGRASWFVLFPLVPWVGVMAVGYWLGVLYRQPPRLRVRWLSTTGTLSLLAFGVLRGCNLYGNPVALGSGGAREPFAVQSSLGMSLVSLLNVEKYPPSLQFLLMTLGVVLLALATLERWRPPWAGPLLVFGRVPLFFYVLHLYLIHVIALLFAVVSGQRWQWLAWGGLPIGSRGGYGHGLGVVFLTWGAVLALLYPACRWYMHLKLRRQGAWLRYL